VAESKFVQLGSNESHGAMTSFQVESSELFDFAYYGSLVEEASLMLRVLSLIHLAVEREVSL
jgi:hypothetical protein